MKYPKFVVLALVIVGAVIISGCVQQNPSNSIQDNVEDGTEIWEEVSNDTEQQVEEDQVTETKTKDSDALDEYPIKCEPQLGFDNYRTEQAFAINPKNNNEMYIHVEYKGFYKSTDGGKTWTFSSKGIKAIPKSDNTSQPCYELHFTMYIDPENPQRILLPGGSAPGKVGMGLGGLAESLDSGKTWHQLFTSEMSAYTESVVTDPRDSNTIYVTTAALPQTKDGPDKGNMFVTKGVVYKTIDGGKTWEELPTGLYTHMRVTGLFLNSKDPNNLRLATFGLPPGTNTDKKSTEEQWGFLETKDAGKTWTKVDSTRGLGIRHVDVSPVNLNHFFMMVSEDNIDKVYYSIDGKTLKQSDSPVNFARYDPKDETGMRLIGLNLYAQPDDIYESSDGGTTWVSVGKLPQGIANDHRASNIVFDPIGKDTIYINSDMARVWKSTDMGKNWELLLSIEKI